MSAEYRYKMIDGNMEAEVFDSEDPADGWCQSPDEAEKAGEEKKPEPQAKAPSPKKNGAKK